MKRILAIILSLLMFTGAAALAEADQGTAAIMTIENIEATVGGQTMQLDGLMVHAALDTIDGKPSIIGMVDGGDEALLTAVAQIVGNSVLYTLDGLDYAYKADMPAQAAQQMGDVETVWPMLLEALDTLELPPIRGLTIRRMDMRGLVQSLGGYGNSFVIPYTQVNMLIEQILGSLPAGTGSIPYMNEILGLIQSMKGSNGGFTIRGTVRGSSAQALTLEAYPVDNGVESDMPILSISANSADNRFSASATIALMGMEMPIGSFELTSDVTGSTLKATLNIANAVNATVDLYQNGSMQMLGLDVSAGGQQISMQAGYGQKNGWDEVTFYAQVSTGESIGFALDSVMGDDGIRTGALAFKAVTSGNTVSVSGDVTMVNGTYIGMEGFRMPTEIRESGAGDTEAEQALIQRVSDYISTHARATTAPAA